MHISMLVWNEFLNDARVLKEAQTLQSAGYQVCVHALHTPGVTKENEELDGGIKVNRVARSPFWKWRKKHRASGGTSKQTATLPSKPKSMAAHRQLLRLVTRVSTHIGLCYQIVKRKPNVIHAHDVNVLPTAWLAAKICRVPLVYDAHEISTSREGYQAFRKTVGWIEKRLMPNVAGTITTTDIRAKYFALAYKIPRPLVLQNRPRLSAPTEQTSYLKEHLQLENDWPIVLYQGGLQPGRGLRKFVRSAALVPNAYFVLIGVGRQTLELQAIAQELNITDRVKFISTVPLAELPLFTASADIGVQPIENTCLNHYTTDSNKLFEYALAGLPVLATDFPEIRKIVQNFEIGQVVSDGSDERFAEALNSMLEDKTQLQVFRTNALKYRDRLCWEEQEHKLINLYHKILENQ